MPAKFHSGLGVCPVVIVMGVSGSGKSTLGSALAAQWGWSFWEGDDFHSNENKAKMASGRPLTEADRLPWLRHIHEKISEEQKAARAQIWACSALKARYREILETGLHSRIKWIYLKGTLQSIRERLSTRQGHFFPVALLESQFEELEEPEDGLTVAVTDSLQDQLKWIERSLDRQTEAGLGPTE